MRYLVYAKSVLNSEYDDSTLENMNSQVEKLKKKHGEEKVSVIKVPSNIKVGYELYREGKYYGHIVAETESLWHISKPGSEIPSPFSKESFESHFINGWFDPVEDIDKEEKLEVEKNGKRRRSSSTERGRQDSKAQEGSK